MLRGGRPRDPRLTAMTNIDVDGGTPSEMSAGGRRIPERSEGCGVGAARALIPDASPGGRPRETDMLNAILCLLRTGCPWRYLLRDRFPPRSTVYNIFRKFQRDGVSEAIRSELHMALPEWTATRPAPRLRFSTVNRSNRRKRAGTDNQVGYDAGKE